jgi:hypothetical protein
MKLLGPAVPLLIRRNILNLTGQGFSESSSEAYFDCVIAADRNF